MLHSFDGKMPHIHPSAYLAPGVQLIGDVVIEENVTIWFNAVLRGDIAPIRIGKGSNVQDGCVGHVNVDQPLIVGEGVSIGHGAIIHGCTIGDGTLIGMGAIILNGASIGEYALIGAGALVAENRAVPARTLSLGSPSKVVRELSDQDLLRMRLTTESYVQKGQEYKAQASR